MAMHAHTNRGGIRSKSKAANEKVSAGMRRFQESLTQKQPPCVHEGGGLNKRIYAGVLNIQGFLICIHQPWLEAPQAELLSTFTFEEDNVQTMIKRTSITLCAVCWFNLNGAPRSAIRICRHLRASER